MDVDDKTSDRCSSGKVQSNNNIVVGTEFLETNKADRPMWLLKCPQAVTRAISNSPEDPSRPVAKVIVSVDPLQSNDDDDSSSKFMMELTGPDSENALRSYSMNMSTDFIPLSVFSESTQGKYTVEGKILNKFDMKPHDQNLEMYGKICRERTHESMIKSRQIQVIDHVRGGGYMTPMPGMDMFSSRAAGKKVGSKGSESKRVRMERGELEKIVFRLFERQPYWTSKQLIQETDQPEQFMKEILRDLCVYNKKGAFQGSYELKPEYKQSCYETKPL